MDQDRGVELFHAGRAVQRRATPQILPPVDGTAHESALSKIHTTNLSRLRRRPRRDRPERRLRRAADGRDIESDQFDHLIADRVSVEALVQLVEGLECLLKRLPADGALLQRDLVLIILSGVAHADCPPDAWDARKTLGPELVDRRFDERPYLT